ncbi:MAG: hypothetical protein JW860_13255 [Sedimentisphaerales bacterium]|nr:hypothetical protein [Sedimentisphaerales bacterium]
MNEEMLEILIGKYLDSEITPAEQKLLDVQLTQNSQARQLLDDWQRVHEQSQEIIAGEIISMGKPPAEIFERAWQQAKRRKFALPVLGGWLRFVTGLAAGIILCISAYKYLLPASQPAVIPEVVELSPPVTSEPEGIKIADLNETASVRPSPIPVIVDRRPRVRELPHVTRNVDWYNFTDDHGDQWMVETLNERKSDVSTAAYHGDL